MKKIGMWEMEYLNKRIEELKKYVISEKDKDKKFLGEMILELYEFIRYLGVEE